jgi:COP9 signalosome complex subunit 5
VTADDETYTLMAGNHNSKLAYSEWIGKIKTHRIIGWYHSHPSYGCWLSGIDVNTQERFQNNTDPFLAIVVDPIKSANLRMTFFKSEKVDIGAFRVYPKGEKDESLGQVKDLPRRKQVDFGHHSQRYYQLPIELVTN